MEQKETNLKNQIECAVKGLEDIKNKNAEVSFVRTPEDLDQGGLDIVLYLSIKLRRNEELENIPDSLNINTSISLNNLENSFDVNKLEEEERSTSNDPCKLEANYDDNEDKSYVVSDDEVEEDDILTSSVKLISEYQKEDVKKEEKEDIIENDTSLPNNSEPQVKDNIKNGTFTSSEVDLQKRNISDKPKNYKTNLKPKATLNNWNDRRLPRNTGYEGKIIKREKASLNDAKTPISKPIVDPNLKSKILKTKDSHEKRKILRTSTVSLPSPSDDEARNISRKKFSLKKIRNQYKFSKSEEKIDKRCKTEPNTPKKTNTEDMRTAEDDLGIPLDIKSFSTECLLIGGISKYCRTRRLKASHTRPVERLWLPGKSTRSTSFNTFCSKKFSRNEELTERSLGNYYYTRVISSSTCRHGRK